MQVLKIDGRFLSFILNNEELAEADFDNKESMILDERN
jgi:hypothetical protein